MYLMAGSDNRLPDDIDTLKDIIIARESLLRLKSKELQDKETELERERIEKERFAFERDEVVQKYEELERKYAYLQKLFFGRKSEKLKPEEELQGRLFDEAETVDGTSDAGLLNSSRYLRTRPYDVRMMSTPETSIVFSEPW